MKTKNQELNNLKIRFRHLTAMALLTAVLFLTSCGVETGGVFGEGGVLDQLLLTKYNNPIYESLLSPDKAVMWKISREGVNGRDNLFMNEVWEQSVQGVTIKPEADGSIVLAGSNNGDTLYWRCSSSVMTLDDGNYPLSDGGFSSSETGAYLYISGLKKTGDETKETLLAILPEQGTFSIDSSLFDEYWCGIHVPNEGPGKEITILPMILKEEAPGDAEEAYIPCPVQHYMGSKKLFTVPIFYADKEEFLEIPEEDYRIFLNTVHYVYGLRYKSPWVSIVFGDGTGITWENCDADHGIYGKTDGFGRIHEAYGEVFFSDGRIHLDPDES